MTRMLIQRQLCLSLFLVGCLVVPPAVQAGGETSTPAAGSGFYSVTDLAVDHDSGALYVLDRERGIVFRVAPDGGMQPFAGGPEAGFTGDGGTAPEARFHFPSALSFDPRTRELFVADTYNYRIRAISTKDLQVRTAAGAGITGVSPRQLPYEPVTPEGLALGRFSGDGGPAADAELNLPSGVAADPIGILFIADSGNHRIRAVNRGNSPVYLMGVEIGPGAIQTIAGTGALGFSGDGGKATEAQLAFPTALAVDASGSLLVVDTFNQRLRKVDRQSGIIRTLAHGALTGVTPERALVSWSVSIAGVAVAANQEVLYTDRVDGSVHRLSRGGDDRILYSKQPRDPGIGSVVVGPRDEIYTADVALNRVLRLDGSAVQTFVEGSERPLPPRPVLKVKGPQEPPPASRPGSKDSSGSRTE